MDAASIAANLEAVRDRIRTAGADPAAVTVVAVTKAFPPAVARAALDAGLFELGENYAQHLVATAEDPLIVGARIRWHFIGALQSNKVKVLAPHVALWETVDRPSIVPAIARAAPGAAVLVQVNGTREPQKNGCPLDDGAVEELVELAVTAGLEVRGLMTVGRRDDPHGTRAAFRAVRARADRLGLADCSMGMTDDLEIAVQEGATIVRIGRQLFGARPPAP